MSTLARNPKLEKLIAKDPDNVEGYLVYGDWLQQQGDPRGELVALQHRLATKPDASLRRREKQILESNGDFVGGIDPQLATLTWRWGFIDSVRIFNKKDWMNSSFDVLPIVRQIFSSPVAAFVRELKLGVIRWMENGQDVPKVLAEVAKLGAADRLRVLRLGDVHDIDIDLAHHPIGKLGVLGQSFRSLEALTVHGYELDLAKEGTLDLPNLRELVIETCALSKKNVRAVAGRKWTKLETLRLWFGSELYGGNCSVKDIAAILDGSAIPKVKRLGLMNAEFTDALCAALPGAKVIKQLDELDLSMGTMSDEGARSLSSNPKTFRHLAKLDVSDNFLSKKAIAELKKIGCPIISKEQKDVEEDEEGFERYVSAAE